MLLAQGIRELELTDDRKHDNIKGTLKNWEYSKA